MTAARIVWAVFACVLSCLAPLAALGGGPRVRPARHDLYDDPLPAAALCRLGTVRFRHQDQVTCVAFSPNGKTLASGGRDGTIRLWEASTGRQFRQFACLGDPADHSALCFSPDGKHLAFARKDDVLCLDLTTGKETHWLGHQKWVRSVAFSPDGKTAASAGGDVRLWDATSGKELRILRGPAEGIVCVTFSPDGKTLVSGNADKTTRFWDVSTGTLLRKIDWNRFRPGADPWVVHSIAFSPDGKTAALGVEAKGGEVTIYLCEVASGKVLHHFPGFDRYIGAMAFSPDGATLAATGYAPMAIILWDAASGRQLRQLSCRTAASSISFSPDGRTLVSGGDDPAVHLWDVATGKERECPAQHLNKVVRIAFAPDGRTVCTISRDRTVRLWEAATGRPRILLQQTTDFPVFPAIDVWFYPNSRTLVCQLKAGILSVHEVATGREVRKLPALDRIQAFAASPDGNFLAVRTSGLLGGERWLRLLDATTGRELRRFPDPINPVGEDAPLAGPLTFSPDGKVLASAFCNPTIRLWDPATGKILGRLEGGEAYTHGITFSPDGKVLASTAGRSDPSGRPIDNTNRLWDTATRRPLSVKAIGEDPFWWAFAPDGRTFADADERDGRLTVYETATGQQFLRFSHPGTRCAAVAFAPDGDRLASGYSDGTAFVWDLAPQEWQAPTAKATAEALQQCWADLAGEDAPRAHRAIYTLAHHGAPALAFLRQHLKPIPKDYAARLRQQIANLDADAFRTREQAVRELTRLGPEAVLPLHAALKAKPSQEAKNRIEALLKKLHPWYIKDAETLRTVRAIWVLQRMATPEARAVLANLAGGAAEARITREAQAALQFLDRAGKP